MNIATLRRTRETSGKVLEPGKIVDIPVDRAEARKYSAAVEFAEVARPEKPKHKEQSLTVEILLARKKARAEAVEAMKSLEQRKVEAAQIEHYGFTIPEDGTLDEYNVLLKRAQSLDRQRPNGIVRQAAEQDIKRACEDSPQLAKMLEDFTVMQSYDKAIRLQKMIQEYENDSAGYVPWKVTEMAGETVARLKPREKIVAVPLAEERVRPVVVLRAPEPSMAQERKPVFGGDVWKSLTSGIGSAWRALGRLRI